MGTLSRKPELKIGDLVLLQEGIPASVFDVSADGTKVHVNWLDEQSKMHRKMVNITGHPSTWGMLKVERLPR
jgi:hypothetical protein